MLVSLARYSWMHCLRTTCSLKRLYDARAIKVAICKLDKYISIIDGKLGWIIFYQIIFYVTNIVLYL